MGVSPGTGAARARAVTHELYACRALPRAVFRGPGGHPTWRRHSLNRSTCQPGGSLLSPCASRC